MPGLTTKAVTIGFAVTLLVLLIYGVVMGYHNSPSLFMTVVAVRLAAGMGLGALAGAVAALIALLRRGGNALQQFVLTTVAAGSLVTVGLVIYNLAV